MKKLPILVFVFLICLACRTTSNVESESVEKINFPQADIVYQAINHRFDESSEKVFPSNNLVGFVNADGSENVQIELKYRAHEPVLSSKAGGMVFKVSKTHPHSLDSGLGPIYFLDYDGTYAICPKLGKYENFYASAYPLASHSLLTVSGDAIQVVDITTCTVTKILVEYSGVSPNGLIVSAYPANLGNKIIYYETGGIEGGIVKILDMDTGAVTDIIRGGEYPSFSPDDREIVYVGKSGIYVATITGANQRLIVPVSTSLTNSLLTPIPYFSPDGSKIVYHKCLNADCRETLDFGIFVFDLKTKTETKIADGGLYPSWIK